MYWLHSLFISVISALTWLWILDCLMVIKYSVAMIWNNANLSYMQHNARIFHGSALIIQIHYCLVLWNDIVYNAEGWILHITLFHGTFMMRLGKSYWKTLKFHHWQGTVFTKISLFPLSSKSTCLERPQKWLVALYRCGCTVLMCGNTSSKVTTEGQICCKHTHMGSHNI